MSHWLHSSLETTYLSYFHMCKQWDLLNENSTMSHWKKLPLVYILYIYIEFFVSSGTWTHTVLHYYFLRIACLPISTCLHNHILYFILHQTHYPKNPIRVTPIFLPFYFYLFNPYQSIHIHSNEYIFNILIHHFYYKNNYTLLHPPTPSYTLLHPPTPSYTLLPKKPTSHKNKNPPYIFIFPLTNIWFIEYHHIGDDMIIYIYSYFIWKIQIDKQNSLSSFTNIYISVLFQHKNFQNKHHMFTLIIESTTCLYFYNSFYLLTYAWCC